MKHKAAQFLTREDFERWLALQTALGWTVKNPESIAKIRKEFENGATLAPFRQVTDNPKQLNP